MRNKILLATVLVYSGITNATESMQMFYEKHARKCETLTCVRNHIDLINVQILQLLVKRTAYVQRAGDIKAPTKVANDQKRVDEQLAQLAARSDQYGLPKEITIETFKQLMSASIAYEQKYIQAKY